MRDHACIFSRGYYYSNAGAIERFFSLSSPAVGHDVTQVATVSMDKSLRLWNFQDKSAELIRFFEEAPLAVSIHPFGLYLLLAFGEKVKYNIPQQFSYSTVTLHSGMCRPPGGTR